MRAVKSSNALTFILFIVSLLVVGALILGAYQAYRGIMKAQGREIDMVELEDLEGNMPITEPRLRRLADWKRFYLVELKLIKDSDYQYKLLIKYDWNNLAESLERYQRDKIIEESEGKLERERRTAFDQIVDVLDNSTANQGELRDWEDDPIMQSVSGKTDSLLGLDLNKITDARKEAEQAVDALMPQITQEGLNDLFKVLDRLTMDVQMKQIIDIKLENRIMKLALPLYIAGRREKGIIFRFDPQFTLQGLKSKMGFTETVKNAFNKLEFWVMDNQMVAFPVGQKDKMIVIPLKGGPGAEGPEQRKPVGYGYGRDYY